MEIDRLHLRRILVSISRVLWLADHLIDLFLQQQLRHVDRIYQRLKRALRFADKLRRGQRDES